LVIQLAKDWRQANITERDKAMLEFAEKMTLDAATMTEVDVQKLRKVDFSDEDILSCSPFRYRLSSVSLTRLAANCRERLSEKMSEFGKP
jgi:hypothetical protein